MATRKTRSTAILAKAEVTYALDPTPDGPNNAMLVTNLAITPLNSQNVDRDLVRSYFGASEQLLGTRYVEMSFDCEFAGSGTVATAPAWAPLVLACGMAQTLTAVVRADYLPITDTLGSVTIYWYDDGVLHKATGCRGNMRVTMRIGERPMLSFTFTGIYATPTANANPALTLTAWKTPQVVVDTNSSDVTFGATHSTTLAPAFVGGTVYPSQGMEVDMGNAVSFIPLLGGETVEITERAVSGSVTLDLTAAQEVTLMSAVEAGTLQTLGLLHGTVANRKSGIWIPQVQLINPAKAEINGKRLISFDLRCVPTSGNDEIRLITSYA